MGIVFDDDEDVPEETPTGLQRLSEGVVSGAAVRPIGAALNLPSRIARGAAVGGQKLLEGTDIIPSVIPGGSGINNPEQLNKLAENVIPAAGRAKEAFQPGFEPAPEEANAALMGDIAGQVPLGMATGGASAAARPLIFNALKMGSSAGLMSAIEQASEKGEIDLWDVTQVAGTGALLPVLKPGGRLLSRWIKATGRGIVSLNTTISKEAADSVVQAGSEVLRKAGNFASGKSVNAGTPDPRLLKEALGEARTVSERAIAIQEAILQRLNKAGERIGKVRAKWGIGRVESEIEDLRNVGFESIETVDDILDDASDYVVGRRSTRIGASGGRRVYDVVEEIPGTPKRIKVKIPDSVESVTKEVGEEIDVATGKRTPRTVEVTRRTPGNEYTVSETPDPKRVTTKASVSEPKTRGTRTYRDPYTGGRADKIPFQERVRGMYETRKKLNEYIKWRKSRAVLKEFTPEEEKKYVRAYEALNSKLDSFAESNPGVKALRDEDAFYETTMEIYEGLQANFADTKTESGKAVQTLVRIAKGGEPGEVLGLTQNIIDRIRLLERETGKKLLDKGIREVFKHSFKNMKSSNAHIGNIIEGLGPEGAEKVLGTARELGSILERIMGAAASPAARAAAVSAAANTTGRRQ